MDDRGDRRPGRWKVLADYVLSILFIWLMLNPSALEDATDQAAAAARRTRDRISHAWGVWNTRRELRDLPETDDPDHDPDQGDVADDARQPADIG